MMDLRISPKCLKIITDKQLVIVRGRRAKELTKEYLRIVDSQVNYEKRMTKFLQKCLHTNKKWNKKLSKSRKLR